jgi:hypothetical protein
MHDTVLILISIYLAIISVAAILLTAADKKAAQSKSRRISEKTLLFVSAIGGCVAMLVTMKIIRHKTKHKRFMHGIPVMIILHIVVAYWFNTYTLNTVRLAIKDERIQNEITIVHLTDLHGATFGRNNSRLISRIDGVSPDIIVVTGDMSTRGGSSDGTDIVVRLLNDLSEKYPVYVVDGGHDGYIRQFITDGRIKATFLDYETAEITIGETTIAIHGVRDKYSREPASFNLSDEMALNKSIYNILIAHEPHFQSYSDFGADLSLCGHTHGGIIRLPFIGTVFHRDIFGDVWFPELRNLRHLRGLIENEDSKLFISSGLGLHPIPVRFFNRPEIAVIRLLPE